MRTLCKVPDRQNGSADRPGILTKREQQVAALACEGLSNKLIARRLEVTDGTIKAHLHAIFSKLGIESRNALTGAVLGRSRVSTRQEYLWQRP